MKVSVFGLGYVGLSNALLLAQHQNVIAYDIVEDRIADLQRGKSPIVDQDIERFLKNEELKITYTTDFEVAVRHGDYLIIATPTNYDEEQNYFDTSSIESVIEAALSIKSDAKFIIKSTIPVGYVQSLKEHYHTQSIIFVPEFLREGRALHDNLYPSRIIVGEASDRGQEIVEMFLQGAKVTNVPTLLTDSTEAEAIKLFSNTYLALRVAYFNELDTYAAMRGLNTQQIIEGVGLDPRIGNHYNNPSFGYGGYCLPKDTKQLKANYQDVPEDLISAIVASNDTRKDFIARQIIEQNPRTVGIYRLVMKAGSDNFRYSSIQSVMAKLSQAGLSLIVYEPTLAGDQFYGYPVVNDFSQFTAEADLIITNRLSQELQPVMHKVYTRDIYRTDD